MKFESHDRTRRKELLLAVAVFILAALPFLNTLNNGLIYDDHFQIEQNPWLGDLSSAPKAFTSSVWSFQEEDTGSGYYRPVMHLAYMIAYAASEREAWGYHLLNVILHSANSALLFLVIISVMRGYCSNDERAKTLPALLGALIFASHPVHSEAVAWAACVPDLSMTFFALISILLFTRPLPSLPALAGAWGAYLFAMFSKEPALLLPIALAFYEFTSKTGSSIKGRALRLIPFAIMATVYLGLRSHSIGSLEAKGSFHDASLFDVAVNAPALAIKYVLMLIAPTNLNFFHDIAIIRSLTDPWALAGAVFAIASLAVFAYLVKRQRVYAFAMLIFFLTLLPALYIPALGRNIFAERYVYLPSIALGLIVSLALYRVLKSPSNTVRTSAVALTIAVIVLFSYVAVKRNTVYKDEITVWSDVAGKSPQSGFVSLSLGTAYAGAKDFDKAIRSYNDAISKGLHENDMKLARYNLANAYAKTNRLDLALDEYAKLVDSGQYDHKTLNNMGAVYAQIGRFDDAAESFEKALAIKPDFIDAQRNFDAINQMRER